MNAQNIDSAETLDQWVILIAWLCPASQVKLVVRCGVEQRQAVMPSDWRTLPEADLLRRLFIPFSTPLEDLVEPDGRCVGRVGFGLGAVATEATLVHGGLRCGKVGMLSGLAVAQPPKDIRRQEGLPLASAQAWGDWAGRILKYKHQLRYMQLWLLHAFAPQLPVPVVRLNETLVPFSEFQAIAKDADEVIALFGELGRRTWDPPELLTMIALEPRVDFAPNVWLFPPTTGHPATAFSYCMDLVDYKKLVEESLRCVWSGWRVEEDVEAIVAFMGQKPLTREVHRYIRQ